jgi:hypothetical protein
LILGWDPPALEDLADISTRSRRQASAVVEAMERMAATGFSLGKRTNRPGIRYWPVPPLGVFYTVTDDRLQVVDVRRLLRLP